MYSSAAHGVVSSYVDQIAKKRAQAFLVDSKRDDDVLVGAVRFAMVTGQLPPKSVTNDVDSRYGVPVTSGIDLIAKGLR